MEVQKTNLTRVIQYSISKDINGAVKKKAKTDIQVNNAQAPAGIRRYAVCYNKAQTDQVRNNQSAYNPRDRSSPPTHLASIPKTCHLESAAKDQNSLHSIERAALETQATRLSGSP